MSLGKWVAAGGITSGINTALSYGKQKKLMEQAYKYTVQNKGLDYMLKQRALKESTGNYIKGLLNAGINPAAMYGGSGGYKAGMKINKKIKYFGDNNGITSTNARDYNAYSY